MANPDSVSIKPSSSSSSFSVFEGYPDRLLCMPDFVWSERSHVSSRDWMFNREVTGLKRDRVSRLKSGLKCSNVIG